MEAKLSSLVSIGAGAMGTALLNGWIRAGLIEPNRVVAVDVILARRQAAERELGVRTSALIEEVVGEAEVVLIAVKPQHIAEVLPKVGRSLSTGTLVISIAAGVPLEQLQKGLGAGTAVVRVMPNTPCLVGAAASGLSAGHFVSDEQVQLALELFQAVGQAFLLPEELLNAVTGLSGSGPAYVYMFIESLVAGGVAAGLPRNVALPLAAQTVLGAARMVLDTGANPAQLRDDVTSPAGTTAAGLLHLERGAFRSSVAEAVLSATQRAGELGREQGKLSMRTKEGNV